MPRNTKEEYTYGEPAAETFERRARRLYDLALAQGGCTLIINGDELVPDPGHPARHPRFVIGGNLHYSKQFTLRLPRAKNVDTAPYVRAANIRAIEEYLVSTVRVYGSWVDPRDGTVCVEPVTIVHDFRTALSVARARNEYSFYDLVAGVEYLTETGEAVA